MNKEEYRQYIEKQYEDDPEGFAIYLDLLFECLKSNEKHESPKKMGGNIGKEAPVKEVENLLLPSRKKQEEKEDE